MIEKRIFLIFVFFLFCTSLVHCADWFQPPPPQKFTFTQTLDHFNPNDNRTFEQVYLLYDGYVNRTKFGSYPAIFFTPGGEAGVRGGYDHNGFLFEMASEIGAFLLFPEHRFYGESLPMGPVDSYKFENIQYLSVQQAIEDYNVIINFIREKYDMPVDKSPLITAGGSYPGELAAFLRIHYPDQVFGALASSAPLLYHPLFRSGGGFYDIATKVFGVQNEKCPDTMRAAFSKISQLFQTQSGIETIANQLGLCSAQLLKPNDKDSFRLLALWIENAFAGLCMDNYPYPIGDSPAWPLLQSCQDMMDTYNNDDTQLLYALRAAINVEYNTTGQVACHNILEEYLPCADITGCGSPSPNGFSWDWQSCTQIVSNVDTSSTSMFPPAPYNFTRIEQYCKERWEATPRPYQLLELYPIHGGSRIIWSNGLYDGWSAGGILEAPNPSQHIVLIEKAAHHLDLRGSSDKDPESVKVARRKEAMIIHEWLDEFSIINQLK